MQDKGKVARILDKARDAGEVVKLIERLRQAILVYQVGIGLYYWGLKRFERETGLATTINIQSSLPVDREFLPLAFN